MEKINIIFIHRGDSWYLPYALKQVKKTNPNANIVLLGDDSNRKYPFIKHFDISNYSKASENFAKVYKHFSTTSYEHELFCIQRWFILLEFMQLHNLNNAMLPDTDVLIFQDVNSFILSVPNDYYYSKGSTNHMGFVYFRNIDNLKLVCDYITNSYTNNSSLIKLEAAYKNWVDEHEIGGVSDITLFDNFEFEYSDVVVNFEYPPINGKAFINSLESSYYQMDKDGYVLFKWKKSVPYATLKNGSVISVMGVHCFGLQKNSIRKLYNAEYWVIGRIIYYWKISIFKKVFDKVRGRR